VFGARVFLIRALFHFFGCLAERVDCRGRDGFRLGLFRGPVRFSGMRMSRVIRSWISMFSCVCLISVMGAEEDRLSGTKVAKEAGDEDATMALLSVFAQALHSIQQEYVREDKATIERLVRGAIAGMASGLDGFSGYLDAESVRALNEAEANRGTGIGVIVEERRGRFVVAATVEGGPAALAGMMPGDEILKVGERAVRGIRMEELSGMLRGSPNKVVHLAVYRSSAQTALEFDVPRAQMEAASVRGARLLLSNGSFASGSRDREPRVGYVRMSRFVETTPSELDRALDVFGERGVDALVLDLRYNPGGSLESVERVAARFLDEGAVIAKTHGRSDGQSEELRVVGEGGNPMMRSAVPLAVLVNGGTASSAEILAGALRDHGRAVVVGGGTMGKGSVQTLLPLRDGSALRLTTAVYLTPSGSPVDRVGIDPDCLVELSSVEEAAFDEYRREEILGKEPSTKAVAYRDRQIDKAQELLRGMLLYRRRGEAVLAGAGRERR
jgi:carboxyl-terminal processing protease